jgi:TatD DNase family protein
MLDSHCHLQFHKFEEDYDIVIKGAIAKGVSLIVNTGTSIPSSRKAVELAQSYENLYAIVGIHPHHADKSDVEFEGELVSNWIEELEKIATSSKKVIGIGEIGMDFFHYQSNGIVEKKLQEDAFRKQIELSIKLKLPLQIHTRLAWDDTLRVLSDYKSKFQNPPGMLHCFSGSIDFAKKVLELGFYVGFDGNITYGKTPPGETTPLIDLVKFVPEDRILTETDSPFLSPVPFRGQRNTPANIKVILEFIALAKGIDYNTLEAKIEQNFRSVFKIS